MAGENITMLHATVEGDLHNYIWTATIGLHWDYVVRENGVIWKALWERK